MTNAKHPNGSPMIDPRSKSALYLRDAWLALDNARYLMSCAIVDAGEDQATAREAISLNLILADVLLRLSRITPTPNLTTDQKC